MATYLALAGAFIGLIIVGLLWSPFAALICLAVARVRRLDGDGWGKAGALYSLTFFLPWVWLVLRMAGVPIPAVVTRAGYAVFYGLWALSCVFLVIAGVFLTAGFGTEALRPDSTIVLSAGLFAGAVWFASLRRTLRLQPPREDAPREDEIIVPTPPSVPMRVAYAAMHVSWTLGTLGMLAQGIFEYATFGGRLDSAIPLWIGGALFALVQIAALKEYGWKTADRWDYPRPPRPSRMPPDSAYIAPFLTLYLMMVIPAGVALAGWILGWILYLQ